MVKKKPNKNETEHVVHIRFGPHDLVRSKREILNSEASMVKILKALKNYKKHRFNELKLKKEFLKNLKGAKRDLEKAEKDLPMIPKKVKEKIHEDDDKKDKGPSEKEKKEKQKSEDLDSQLREIKEKLRSLENQV